MKISFNPSINNCNKKSFCSAKNAEQQQRTVIEPTKDKIQTAKTKKVVSECSCIAIGVCMLYFAMKRTFKYGEIAKHKKKAEEVAKLIPPAVINLKEITS